MEKKFTVKEQDTNMDLVGGKVGIKNVYISMYPVIINSNYKNIEDLEIEEKTAVFYNMNSNTGHSNSILAWIKRVA